MRLFCDLSDMGSGLRPQFGLMSPSQSPGMQSVPNPPQLKRVLQVEDAHM